MRIRKGHGRVDIIFEEDDLYITVEAGEVEDEETGVDLGIMEVSKSFNLSQFDEAVKFYLKTKEKYPDAELKIVSKTNNTHNALLYAGYGRKFLSVSLNSKELESNILKKFEKIKEILEE